MSLADRWRNGAARTIARRLRAWADSLYVEAPPAEAGAGDGPPDEADGPAGGDLPTEAYAPMDGGPPAHWVEKVRRGAPWLLENVAKPPGERRERALPPPEGNGLPSMASGATANAPATPPRRSGRSATRRRGWPLGRNTLREPSAAAREAEPPNREVPAAAASGARGEAAEAMPPRTAGRSATEDRPSPKEAAAPSRELAPAAGDFWGAEMAAAKHVAPPNLEVPAAAKHGAPPNPEVPAAAKHVAPTNPEVPAAAKHVAPPNPEVPAAAKHVAPPNREVPAAAKHVAPPNPDVTAAAKHIAPPNREVPAAAAFAQTAEAAPAREAAPSHRGAPATAAMPRGRWGRSTAEGAPSPLPPEAIREPPSAAAPSGRESFHAGGTERPVAAAPEQPGAWNHDGHRHRAPAPPLAAIGRASGGQPAPSAPGMGAPVAPPARASAPEVVFPRVALTLARPPEAPRGHMAPPARDPWPLAEAPDAQPPRAPLAASAPAGGVAEVDPWPPLPEAARELPRSPWTELREATRRERLEREQRGG